MPITARPIPRSGLLTPKDRALIMIDFQSRMAFATRSAKAMFAAHEA